MHPIKTCCAFLIGAQSILLLFLLTAASAHAGDGLNLNEVKWEGGDQDLVVKGEDAGRYANVTVSNAASGVVLAVFAANREGRFEKKIHDLKLSRMVAIQSLPQIRLIQSNDQALVEKIQSSILNTIPLWKNQVVIAIGLFRQKKAVELQKEVSETTNELLEKNAELLKQNSIEVVVWSS